MNISLEINGVLFELESTVDQSQLRAAHFNKVGFFTRLFLPFPKKQGDSVYFSKNPQITLFSFSTQSVYLLSIFEVECLSRYGSY